jgi:hypothetical protein
MLASKKKSAKKRPPFFGGSKNRLFQKKDPGKYEK